MLCWYLKIWEALFNNHGIILNSLRITCAMAGHVLACCCSCSHFAVEAWCLIGRLMLDYIWILPKQVGIDAPQVYLYIYIFINILIPMHLIETSNFENSGGHTPSPISEIMLTKRAFRPGESWSSSGWPGTATCSGASKWTAWPENWTCWTPKYHVSFNSGIVQVVWCKFVRFIGPRQHEFKAESNNKQR